MLQIYLQEHKDISKDQRPCLYLADIYFPETQ